MKIKMILSIVFSVLFFVGCGSSTSNIEKKKVYGFSFIDGEVIASFDDKVIVKIDDKDVVEGDSYEDILTNKIIKSSLFITGLKTKISREDAIVSDVRGQEITFDVKDAVFVSGQKVKIYLPKKTIAIMDFSLSGITNSDANKFAMEDMTTKMVQSGQYVVVERQKLDTILREQELADSGLLEQNSASKIGKLASADIILTGSFAKSGGKWNVSLRLVDVETGIIISAIKDKISADEFRPKQSKDISNFTENFEDDIFAKGWLENVVNKRGSKSKGMIDKSTGAKNTKHSYRMDVLLRKDNSVALFVNRRLRDVSQYKGIKFYAKATKNTTMALNIHDQNYDNGHLNRWKTVISVRETWKEFRIPFNELTLGRNYARNNPGGDGALDLDNLFNVVFGMNGRSNGIGEKYSLWIDEISFY